MRPGVDVPMPTKSVIVVNRTEVPSSVQPPALAAEQTPFDEVHTRPPPSAKSRPSISRRPVIVEVPVFKTFKTLSIVVVPLIYTSPTTPS